MKTIYLLLISSFIMMNAYSQVTNAQNKIGPKKLSILAAEMNENFRGKPLKGAYKRWKRAEYYFEHHLNERGE